jgi:hypothetical protein
VIQLEIRIVIRYVAAERRAQKGDVVARVAPPIDADQSAWREAPRRLFQGLADHGVEQALAFIQMTRGLIKNALPVN